MSAGPERIVRDDVRAMSAYAVADATGLVKLDAMENPYPLPEALRRDSAEVVAATATALNRYPDPGAPALVRRLRQVMGIAEEHALLLGNGSDEIIHIIIQCVARPGAVVLAPAPGFVMFGLYAQFAGLKFVGVPLREDFGLDVRGFIAAMREHTPAVVFIATPNNPSGNQFPEEDLAAIVAAAPGLVVIDEAYHAFARRSFLPRLAEFPNLVLMRTLSKLGLAGIRLGFVAGRREWIAEFDKVRPPYNVNVLTQAVAERALAHHEVLEAQARAIVAGREVLAAALRAMPRVRVFPSDANFLLVRVPDAPKIFEGMRRRGVLVKNLHGGMPLLEHCIRITVGTPEENRRCLAALSQALADV